MDEPSQRERHGIPFRAMVPNAITLLALCFGLTGVSLAIGGEWERALGAVVFGFFGWRASKLGNPREATNFVAVSLAVVLGVLWLFLLGSLVPVVATGMEKHVPGNSGMAGTAPPVDLS